MTVRELVATLQYHDQDAEVVLWVTPDGAGFEVAEVVPGDANEVELQAGAPLAPL